MRSRLWLVAAILLLPWQLFAQTYEVEQIADGVYVAIRPGVLQYPVEGNITFIVNDEDVIVVDSPRTPSNARAVLEELRKLTDKPVRFLINTHWHGDHHHGNFVFKQAYPKMEILSSAPAREEIRTRGKESLERQIRAFTDPAIVETMATATTDREGNPLLPAQIYRNRSFAAVAPEYGKELEQVVLMPPSMTFEGATVLYRGDRTIRVFNNGYGNTAGDTMVYLEKERILITGDLLVSTVPFMSGSRPRGWLARLKEIEAMEFDLIVPGHGALQRDRTWVRRHIALLESLIAQVESAVADGLTLEETIERVDLAEFRRAYANGDENVGFEFDARITLSAIRDAYNGTPKE